jgi:hypothetical protein
MDAGQPGNRLNARKWRLNKNAPHGSTPYTMPLSEGVCSTFACPPVDAPREPQYHLHMHFRTALKLEFRRRTGRNPRYSLRAFARDLGSDHATLSQIFRGRRSLSPRMVRRFGARLRLHPAIVADASGRQTAEAVLRLAQTPGFCVQSRWIATRTGLPVDTVNIALHRLLRDGDLVMVSSTSWKTTRLHYA